MTSGVLSCEEDEGKVLPLTSADTRLNLLAGDYRDAKANKTSSPVKRRDDAFSFTREEAT